MVNKGMYYRLVEAEERPCRARDDAECLVGVSKQSKVVIGVRCPSIVLLVLDAAVLAHTTVVRLVIRFLRGELGQLGLKLCSERV